MVRLKTTPTWHVEGTLAPAQRSTQRSGFAAAQTAFEDRHATKGVKVTHRFKFIPFVTLMADIGVLLDLGADEDVESIELDDIGKSGLLQSAPLVTAPSAWSAGYTGAGQRIAIIDSGVQSSHPFLINKVVSESCFSEVKSAYDESLCPGGLFEVKEQTGAGVNCPMSLDECWHGTHVAGIAAGRNGENGMNGIAKDASLIAIQVFHLTYDPAYCGSTTPCARFHFSDAVKALDQVYDQTGSMSIAAVNMSLTSGWFYGQRSDCNAGFSAFQTSIGNLRSVGVAVIGITGNDSNKSQLTAPGCVTNAIDVGASTKSDVVAAFSNSAPPVNGVAPTFDRRLRHRTTGGHGERRWPLHTSQERSLSSDRSHPPQVYRLS